MLLATVRLAETASVPQRTADEQAQASNSPATQQQDSETRADVSDESSASTDGPAQPRLPDTQAALEQLARSREQPVVPVTGLLGVKPYTVPEPFRQRPRLGSRLFVQSHFPGMAAALAAEMCSWQTDLRIK